MTVILWFIRTHTTLLYVFFFCASYFFRINVYVKQLLICWYLQSNYFYSFYHFDKADYLISADMTSLIIVIFYIHMLWDILFLFFFYFASISKAYQFLENTIVHKFWSLCSSKRTKNKYIPMIHVQLSNFIVMHANLIAKIVYVLIGTRLLVRYSFNIRREDIQFFNGWLSFTTCQTFCLKTWLIMYILMIC